MPVFISRVNLTDRKVLVACFSLGFLTRLIPELLSWPFPIGVDTVYYALVMKNGVIWPDWGSFFTSSWLFTAMIVPVQGLFYVDPFLLLKFVGPLLFGLNVAGVYWFARKMLNWSTRMSVFAGVFFALQLASLRISWDLLRNTLGLGILLFALSYFKDAAAKRDLTLFAILSLLTVFAHEYAAVILVFSILGLGIWHLITRRVKPFPMRVLFGIPAVALFLFSMVVRLYFFQAGSSYIDAGDAVTGRAEGLPFFVNYLQIQTSVDSYGNYGNLVFNVVVLFVVLFLPYLFLVLKGFFRNNVLDLWTILLLIGAFGCLVVPFFALEYWHRWMFMLAYPFTFYAVSGLWRTCSKPGEKVNNHPLKFSDKMALGMVLLTFSLGFAYLASPVLLAYSTSLPSVTLTSRYFAVAPGTPYKDVRSMEQALTWLDKQMTPDSAVILQHVFLSWGKMYLNNSHTIVDFEVNAAIATTKAFDSGFTEVFFIWWNISPGWYGVSVPNGFVSVQEYDSISVYKCAARNLGGS